MLVEPEKPIGAAEYLRQQADRCQRLSRTCMDLSIARDLRMMAQEYSSKASTIDANTASRPH